MSPPRDEGLASGDRLTLQPLHDDIRLCQPAKVEFYAAKLTCSELAPVIHWMPRDMFSCGQSEGSSQWYRILTTGA